MSIFFEKISKVLVSLWVGGLWTMLMVTTVLFNKMPNYIASSLALDMHLFVNLFGVISSLILLFLGFKSTGAAYLKSSIFWTRFFVTSTFNLSVNFFIKLAYDIRTIVQNVFKFSNRIVFKSFHSFLENGFCKLINFL